MNDIIIADAVPFLREHKNLYDIIIADPPYNIGKNFGNNFDNMPIDEYIEWSQQWIDYCLKLLKADGILYIYGFSEILARISARYPYDSQRWLVWHYTNKTVPKLKFWQRSHESILCMWNPDYPRPDLEIDQIRVPYTKTFLDNAAGKSRKPTPGRYGKDNITTYNAHKNGALPRDVITVPALAGGAGASERWFICEDCGNQIFPPSQIKNHKTHSIWKHPTQKPMELTKKLIMSRISESGSVLVPFAGSGSECLVADTMGLDWLGIEINPLYVDFAKKWIAAYE